MAWVKQSSGKWSGKTWAVLGDSNSFNTYAKPYHQRIKEKTGINVLNYAVGGAGWISKNSTGQSPRIIEQLASASPNADIITALAGGNDYFWDFPLGEMGDTTFDTFYGALDTTIKAMIDKYPFKKIAILTQFRRAWETTQPNGTSVELQVNATIEVCKKYSIPVLDLYHHGNMYPWNTEWFNQCMENDGVHLKDKGQEILSEKVNVFIGSLLA